LKLYENVVIGNFLYGLGHSIGNATKEKRQLSIINLLQQTPSDKLLGDVLLEYTGVVRLIEFKNRERESSLTKEKKRHNQLELMIGDNEKLQKISREIHWYVETKPFEQVCLNNINPYLDAFSGNESTYTVESFIENITESVVKKDSDITPEEFEAYLALVSTCQGGGDVATGGLVVAMDKEGIKYLQFADIMQLRLQHKEYVEKVQKEYKSIMSKQIKQERTLDRDYSRGMSR
jgi:hypothetical protein